MKKRIGILCAAGVVAGASLAPSVAAAGTLKVGGSTGAQLLIQSVETGFNKKYSSQGVSAAPYAGVGSGAGIRGVAAGTYDVGGSSRDPASSDPKGLVFTPISKESIVVVVNPSNPLCKKGLTKDQVKAIFTGTATDWSQVGGPASLGPIKVYTRVSTSGTQASFGKVFLDGALPKGSPLFSNGAIRSQVSHGKNAIGFVTGAYTATSTTVCGVPIGGVAPTLRNTASGRYKYWNYQYVVTKGEPAGDIAT